MSSVISRAEVAMVWRLFRSDAAKDKPSMKVKFEKGEELRLGNPTVKPRARA